MQDLLVGATANLGTAGLLREGVLALGPRLAQRGLDVPRERLQAWGLAVYEAATNVVRHAGAPSMTLSYKVGDQEVVFRLADGGREHHAWTSLAPPEPQAEGGYGLWIIRSLMHEVGYRRLGDGNVLDLVGCVPVCEACASRARGAGLPV